MIVGVDLSTYRIDLAWLEHGKPQRWHQELGAAKDDTIDRLRRIHVMWPSRIWAGDGEDVTDVCIEWPWGRGKALPPLMATVGIITRQAPAWARVSWVKSHDLRAAIGARNRKYDAGIRIQTLCNLPHPSDPDAWNEHELDALTACIGWTRILEQQEAA